MTDSPLIPDLDGIPVNDDAEPDDADTTHTAGVDLDTDDDTDDDGEVS